MITTRDLQQQNQAKLDAKRDNSQVTRAVILEINGSVWANESERRVWYLPNGATQPGQVLCIRGGVRPQDNLPVLVGKADGSDVLEVLSVDPLVMVNQAALPPQVADHAREHEPGGRDVLNLYSRQLVPLQVYYAGSGLLISVVSGWYDYRGTLTRFKGRQNFDLASNQPTSGNVRKVGIYIDSANALQAVNGSTVADTVTNIPEPIWPAGSFPLCVVRLNGTQTTITYADIQDRRGLFGLSDINLFPPEDKVIIGTTTYDDFTAANAAAGAGDFVHIGPGSLAFDSLTLKAATYKGQGPEATTLTSTYSAGTVLTLPDGCVLQDLLIDLNINSASTRSGVGITGTVIIRNCKIDVSNSGGGGLNALAAGSSTLILDNVEVIGDGGSSITYALNIFQANVTAYNCIFNAISSGTFVGGGAPYARDVGILDSAGVFNGYNCQLVHDRLFRANDFGLANIITSWAASPPQQFNPIVNGGLEIWPVTSFTALTSNQSTLNGFRYIKSGSMVHNISQSSDVPTFAQAGTLLTSSLLIDCTTADTSIAPSDITYLQYSIEGYNWRRFAQDGFWLSFWLKATKTGVYSLGLRNSGTDRSFVAEYTINTTATWEYKEIYIPASPSAGTWDYSNGIGVSLLWSLAAGSSYSPAANWQWEASAARASANQVNACDSASNDWRITGIMMSKTRSPFWQPDYQQELARAQRYYWQTGSTKPIGMGIRLSGNTVRVYIPTPVTMRDVPTTDSTKYLNLYGNGAAISVSSASVSSVESNAVLVDVVGATTPASNTPYVLFSNGSAPLSAEL